MIINYIVYLDNISVCVCVEFMVNTKCRKKIKVSISLNRQLYYKIKSDNLKTSRIIEKLVEEYYGNKDL